MIFDLDGVITDTARAHYRAWKRLADELGAGLVSIVAGVAEILARDGLGSGHDGADSNRGCADAADDGP